jgi:hypothetical protein
MILTNTRIITTNSQREILKSKLLCFRAFHNQNETLKEDMPNANTQQESY